MTNRPKISATLGHEEQLLLLLSRTDINKENCHKIHSMLKNDIDWFYLVKIADHHRLYPLLYHNIKSICPDAVPELILNFLEKSFNKNLYKNLYWTRELLNILKMFKDHSITAIPYKGPLLASEVYGNLSFRVFSDIQILIRKEDASKAKDLLIARAYKDTSPFNIGLNKNWYIENQRGYKLFNKENSVSIHLIWQIPEKSFSFPFEFNSIHPEEILETVEINRHKVLSFPPEILLLILCVHNAGHRWKYLSWLLDMVELVKNRDIHWEIVREKAEELAIKRIVLVNLLLINDLWGISIPLEFIHELESDQNVKEISALIKKQLFTDDYIPPNLGEYASLHLKLRDNLKDGLKDAIHHVIEPNLDDLNVLGMPKFLLHFYPVVCPILLLKKYGMGPFKKIKPGEYVQTPLKVVDEMLKLAEVGPNDVLYDLGCGDGRIVIAAAKKFGARGVGIDIDPKRINESEANAIKEGVEHLTKFKKQDMRRTDISEASVISFYVYSFFLDEYKSKLEKELKPGTRIISHDYKITGWEPEKTKYVLDKHVSTVYLWRL